jgi:cellulose synthase/poly-beta-1,6-N-acetylglucosamine synthase-like glycosyltransferase
MLSGWVGRGTALCVGTNVVYSRESLKAIGGWGVHSVTEDVLTSYLLQGEWREERGGGERDRQTERERDRHKQTERAR